MILEHAVLQVDPSQSARFEAAFDVARTIISEVPGFIRLRLSHCLESPERYLLLVEWEDGSHTPSGSVSRQDTRSGENFSITSTSRSRRWSTIRLCSRSSKA
ncbi:antibiotic biosynthesis monooxygenase [Rhodococcus sp. 3Y1]